MDYDYPVFEASTEKELKSTVTYKDFIENNIRFEIKEFGNSFSIFRPKEDIRLVN